MRKVPMRMCIVTREKLPKNELLRIVKSGDEVLIDLTGKINGKGCYLKKEKEVIEKAIKRKTLDKALGVNVPDKIYEDILNML